MTYGLTRIDTNKEIQLLDQQSYCTIGNTVAETNDFETIESGLRFSRNRISYIHHPTRFYVPSYVMKVVSHPRYRFLR